MRLDQALLELGQIDAQRLERAKRAKDGDPSQLLGALLQQIGGVDEEAIRAGLAFQLGVPTADLRCWPFDRDVLSELSPTIARRWGALPLHMEDNVLYVALSDVLSAEALAAVSFSTSCSVQPVYAPAADIMWALDAHYLSEVVAPVSDEDLERHTLHYQKMHATPREHLSASDNVIVRLADLIIAEAHRERASDIHIEPIPQQSQIIVRTRVDGRMFVRRTIPWAYRDALVSRIKVMASLNVADHRNPQDGKILFRHTGAAPIELRVAVLPTAGGVEDVVLRVLDTSTPLPLAALGLGASNHPRLLELVEKPYGILLVCGPTGSGKTTTLHAALRHLNDGSRKICTVENPVEITQPGLRQVEVNERAGLTFATALRAFLRADPDVIMVGEIRDAETARTALEASLTGHLVLSTLHTNGAPESVVRLLEMGMNPFNFADSLVGILAQRLVRCLCTSCRRAEDANEDMLAALAREYTGEYGTDAERDAVIERWRRVHGRGGRIVLYRAGACSECRGTGYRRRLGLFELMAASNAVRRLIMAGAPVSDLLRQAVADGMHTLKQDGIQKVLDGHTDLAQVLAVSRR